VSGSKLRSRLLVPAVGLIAALGIAACGSDDSTGTSADTGGGGGKIAFMLPETQTARYETQDKPLFEQKVQELCPDCEILYQNADQDPTKQQSQVEAAVTEGVDVIVLDPVDSTSAAGMVSRAQQADIPVISYDRLILDADLAAYAEFNSPEVGKQQGTALSEALADNGNPTGPIVQINGDPKDNNAKLFKEGATSVFTDKGIDVAKEYDTPDWLPENAQKEMDQAITALGKDGFKGVLAANDGTAGGAIAALKAAGIDPTTIPVTGQDAELAAIQRIIAGEQYMTVYKPIQPLADNAATLAVAVVNGDDPASSDVINGEEDNAATLAVAVVNGEDPADSDVINGTENNGTEDVPTAITDTIPVFEDNVKDTVVKDGYWTAQDICTKQYAQDCKDAGIQ
jgi:D-xylose transport system substrate-binding protein